jgi:hypothetical protein
VAALRYQHATADRDRALANALASMATQSGTTALPVTETVTAEIRTKLAEAEEEVCDHNAPDQPRYRAVPTGFEPVSPP